MQTNNTLPYFFLALIIVASVTIAPSSLNNNSVYGQETTQQ
ncbi:MAG TPA: hypothetical protein VGE97_08255 [Nitrososphaera sp.]|jgi:hypothetical protein